MARSTLFRRGAIVLTTILAAASAAQAEPQGQASARSIEHGRYLVKLGGCNDCHTPGYATSGGQVPQEQWLTGDVLGWHGPWGTTYPANLRLYFAQITEDQWVKTARTAQYRPPMPWFTLRALEERDLRDIYRFIHALGPAGQAAPSYRDPSQAPQAPYVDWVLPAPAPAASK